jgi:hypothetical protein
VLRGGTWNNNENNLRTSNRNGNNPDNINNNNGFRCVRLLPSFSSTRIQHVHGCAGGVAEVSAGGSCPAVLPGEYKQVPLPLPRGQLERDDCVADHPFHMGRGITGGWNTKSPIVTASEKIIPRGSPNLPRPPVALTYCDPSASDVQRMYEGCANPSFLN